MTAKEYLKRAEQRLLLSSMLVHPLNDKDFKDLCKMFDTYAKLKAKEAYEAGQHDQLCCYVYDQKPTKYEQWKEKNK